MAEISDETRVLLEAADRAIATSRELVEQNRKVMAECERANHRQQLRLIFLREIAKLK